MADYKTPDVYVEEISTLPPSVAEVSTAVPAFIGYTELADQVNVPVRITSFLEFKTYFGGPYRPKYTVRANGNEVHDTTADFLQQHKLYYAIDHYFRNGGSDCYIVSLGAFDVKTAGAFADGLDALKTEDEPTLIVLSEATTLASADEYYTLCNQALLQCADLKDRFCIIDVYPAEKVNSITAFRDGIGMNNLKYGAAYYPYLNTSMSYIYDEAEVEVDFQSADLKGVRVIGSWRIPEQKAEVRAVADAALPVAFAVTKSTTDVKTGTDKDGADIITKVESHTLTITIGKDADGKVKEVTLRDVAEAWKNWNQAAGSGFSLLLTGAPGQVLAVTDAAVTLASQTTTLDALRASQTAVYNAVKQELNKQKIILPPSPAVAGVYAATDRERGVWKAPANVSLNAVISPTVKISANDQESLNVDVNGGKSINAIRGFLGKGTLVWGARTLAGNDNEWRYVPVRRLFNMIEESAKKASYFGVFEPNEPTTWLKVKGMIESFLYRLWQQGALSGSAPKAAYYVNIGLGTTMTQQDILEGRMIVEIGIAAVRPAEFIVLRFSHKLQEA